MAQVRAISPDDPDFPYNARLAGLPGNPDVAYIDNLDTVVATSPDRTARYRAQAELEDIEDGRWHGARTDDPPADWQG